MMLAPEKRTKFFPQLRQVVGHSVYGYLRVRAQVYPDDPAFESPLCLQVSHGLPVSQHTPALLLYSCSSYRCQKGIPLMR